MRFNSDAYTHTYCYGYTNSDTNCEPNSNPYAYRHADCHRYANIDADANS